MTTLVMVFWGDSRTSLVIRTTLWFFLIVAYISIPLNFENPKRESFEGYLLNKKLFTIFVPLQMLFLGFGVFALTALSCYWFIPSLKESGVVIGALNALLYAGCIGFVSMRLRDRLAT